ncbi:hypothetical protein A2U01_0090721, partial [Trifolium medium]|nr:hypothetical protein [Trifolium medium]
YIPEDISAELSALSRCENFPQTMVISGGAFNKITIGSVKKFEELIDASSNMSATLDKAECKSLPLAFYLEELPGGSANANI